MPSWILIARRKENLVFVIWLLHRSYVTICNLDDKAVKRPANSWMAAKTDSISN